MTNLPDLDDIDADALRHLPLDVLDALTERAERQKNEADAAKKAITGELARRYETKISLAYLREHKDTGLIHLEDAGFDLAVERPKRVEWDQEMLAKLGDEISAAGDDPHEYIKTALSVDERKFTAWPSYLRERFIAARTVKAGAVTIKLSKLEGVA